MSRASTASRRSRWFSLRPLLPSSRVAFPWWYGRLLMLAALPLVALWTAAAPALAWAQARIAPAATPLADAPRAYEAEELAEASA
ncbi:MAG TPA: hypothetical protein VFE37_00765, partial [Chloroflexota bacterium]|nr:hypothetical protein [Chloroflexota bacterium]